MEGPLTRRPPALHSTPRTLAVKPCRIQVMTIREIGVIANEEVDDEGETGDALNGHLKTCGAQHKTPNQKV